MWNALIFIFLLIPEQEKMNSEELFRCLGNGYEIQYEIVKGKFHYYFSDYDSGVFKSLFSTESEYEIAYYHNAGSSMDTLVIGDSSFPLINKYDPMSMNLYEVKHEEEAFLVFTGNAISASGSGSQLTYYLMIEKLSSEQLGNSFSFSSRFGSMANIGDLDRDGEIDYIKLENNGKEQSFNCLAYDIKTDRNISRDKFVELQYLNNNNFRIIGGEWYHDIKCGR